MVRLGDLLIEVRNEIQRGIDAIEVESDAADREGPNVEVASVELDIPFGVSEETSDGEPSAEEALERGSLAKEASPTESPGDESAAEGDGERTEKGERRPTADLDVRPGATGGTFSVRFAPSARRRRTRSADRKAEGSADGTPDALRSMDPLIADRMPPSLFPDGMDRGSESGDRDVQGPERGGMAGSVLAGTHPTLIDPPDVDEEESPPGSDGGDGPGTGWESDFGVDADTPLEAVPGVGDTYGERLREGGIRDVPSLAEVPADRVAEVIDAGSRRSSRIVRTAELMCLGVRPDTARLLAVAGFDGDRLAATRPDDVLRAVRDVLPEVRLPDGYDPDESELRWVLERARETREE
jgi:hypothetical protein